MTRAFGGLDDQSPPRSGSFQGLVKNPREPPVPSLTFWRPGAPYPYFRPVQGADRDLEPRRFRAGCGSPVAENIVLVDDSAADLAGADARGPLRPRSSRLDLGPGGPAHAHRTPPHQPRHT